jgi:hypothetical protein
MPEPLDYRSPETEKEQTSIGCALGFVITFGMLAITLLAILAVVVSALVLVACITLRQ